MEGGGNGAEVVRERAFVVVLKIMEVCVFGRVGCVGEVVEVVEVVDIVTVSCGSCSIFELGLVLWNR
jgi:hypothetical protein